MRSMNYNNGDNRNKLLYGYKDSYPLISPDVFLAPGVKIIGDVTIAGGSSIWYNTIIRGDVNFIKIGTNTNIQDMCMLHCTPGNFALRIGNNVTVGHNVTLHGCTIHDNTLVGMGAIILDGAVVEENSIVAAGALVKEGFIVPSKKLVAGIPARIIRDVTSEEIIGIAKSSEHYIENAKIYINSSDV